MYFYYKKKFENKSKDNEYLAKNFNFTNFFKNMIKNFWLVLAKGYDSQIFIFSQVLIDAHHLAISRFRKKTSDKENKISCVKSLP